jgi:hypothetical protein
LHLIAFGNIDSNAERSRSVGAQFSGEAPRLFAIAIGDHHPRAIPQKTSHDTFAEPLRATRYDNDAVIQSFHDDLTVLPGF